MSSLYTLLREYEERRQALVDQLQKNPNLDPAVQHQIYGAIKEIENFLKSIEFQIANDQEKNLALDLARDRPRPFREKTKRVVDKVKSHTSKVVKEHIPSVSKKVAAVPKRYFAKRREKAKLRREIEQEVQKRLLTTAVPSLEEQVQPQPAPVQEAPAEMPVQEESLQPKAVVKKAVKRKKAKKRKKRKR